MADEELQDVSLTLSPLLSDDKQKSAEYRVRSHAYEFKSVHPADAEVEVAKGWESHKLRKRSTLLKRAKSHDRALEDRIWCVLYRMGYPELSGGQFEVSFNRSTGAHGHKQIDVFATDVATAFVVECKSKLDRGRRALQKDLSETHALQKYIRQTIRRHVGVASNPKVIWVYATQNIIWSETDLERAHDFGISVITENEIQYLEAFIRHMGPAGRHQILADFLRGQKIPALSDVKLPAVRGKIAGETFYSFVCSPGRLLPIAFVNHQALNHPDGTPAYQRMVSSSRIRKIGKFIENGGYFPTNIIINFTESPRFDLLSNKENTDPNLTFGWITLPSKYRSAWIIDGQHRLYGYSHLDERFLSQSLFVLAFDHMPTRKEADLFITINHEQKSVPKSLLVSLLADLRMGVTCSPEISPV